MEYTERDIRIAGEHGELSSIDIEHLIEILKRNKVKGKFPDLTFADASIICTTGEYTEAFLAKFGEHPDIVMDNKGRVGVLNPKFIKWQQ